MALFFHKLSNDEKGIKDEKIEKKIYNKKRVNIVNCECGSKYNNDSKSKYERHIQTKKHKKYLNKY
jgi:hypothetical protein